MVSLFRYFRSIGKADKLHFELGPVWAGHRREKSVVLQRVYVVSQDAKFLEAMDREWSSKGALLEVESLRPLAELRLPVAAVAVLDGYDGLPMLSGAEAMAVVVDTDGAAGVAPLAARVLRVARAAGWAAVAAALAQECALRREAEERATRLEQRLRAASGSCGLERMPSAERHELANVMTVALGYCELVLMEERLAKKIRQRVEAVHGAISRMDTLLRFMLHKMPVEKTADIPADRPQTAADANEFRGA